MSRDPTRLDIDDQLRCDLLAERIVESGTGSILGYQQKRVLSSEQSMWLFSAFFYNLVGRFDDGVPIKYYPRFSSLAYAGGPLCSRNALASARGTVGSVV